MTETLEQIKKTVAEAKDLGIINWNTDTIQFLLTTIESQKEEIDYFHMWSGEARTIELINQLGSQKEEIEKLGEDVVEMSNRLIDQNNRTTDLQQLFNHQKDITELAVKAFESISNGYYNAAEVKAFSTGILREIKAMK